MYIIFVVESIKWDKKILRFRHSIIHRDVDIPLKKINHNHSYTHVMTSTICCDTHIWIALSLCLISLLFIGYYSTPYEHIGWYLSSNCTDQGCYRELILRKQPHFCSPVPVSESEIQGLWNETPFLKLLIILLVMGRFS